MSRINIIVILVCLSLQSYMISANTGDNLVLQQASVVFRHGDRTPGDFKILTDPYTESDWPQGYSQLTIAGMQQEYQLGELLRNRYTSECNLIYDNYTRVQVNVRSTDYDRTLMSAETLLAGLFPPGPSQRFDQNISWQPVPVHTVPRRDDFLLRPTSSCRRFQELINENQNYAFYTDMEAKYQPFMDMIGEITGVIPCNFSNIFRIEDTIFIQSISEGYDPPSWANASVIKTLGKIADFTLSALFIGEKSELKQRLSAGTLLNKILTDMKSKVEDGQTDDSKLFLYSGHDSTIVSVTSSLKVHNGKRQGYASALLIELYSNSNNNYFVKVFLRDGPTNNTFVELNIPCNTGSSSTCTLEEFKTLIMPLIPTDIMMECGGTSASSASGSSGYRDATIVLGVFVGLLLVAVIILIVILFLREFGRKSKE